MTITRRELYRLTVAAAAGAILPKAAFAFGGPSGAHTIYKVQVFTDGNDGQWLVFDQRIIDACFRVFVLRQRKGEVLLCIQVNEQHTSSLQCECCAYTCSRGGLADSTFLITDCYCQVSFPHYD